MRTWLRWLPPILWMAAIFYFSSRTGDDLSGWLIYIHRIIPSMQGFDWGHFVSYFVLALTYWWAWRPARRPLLAKIGVVALCVLYGMTDEYHQIFVPGRTSDLMDLRNDAIGAALGMIFVSIPAVERWFRRQTRAKYY